MMKISGGNEQGSGGTDMRSFHNRTSFTILAVAVIILLTGFGCAKNEAPLGARTGSPSSDDARDDGELPTSWTEYRSEELGIAIPYPEGWYVEEGSDAVSFYLTEPPLESDMPANAWFEREAGTIRDALSGLDIASEDVVTRSGRSMTRTEFIEDFYDPSPRVLLYLWEENGQTLQIGGPNREVVEYIIERIEVLP